MSLKSWNASSDLFSYTELDANWSKVDAHDHTTGKGVQIPSAGIATGAVTATQLASNAVTTAKITDANVTDAKLASPNSGVWRTVMQTTANLSSSQVAGAGTYWFRADGAGTIASASTAGCGAVGFLPTTSDYAVAGKTNSMRVLYTATVNGTAPAQTVTFGLHAGTPAGGANVTGYTLAASVAGSAIALTTPASGTSTSAASSGFNITALTGSANYVFGMVANGAIAASSFVSVTLSLQMRHT